MLPVVPKLSQSPAYRQAGKEEFIFHFRCANIIVFNVLASVFIKNMIFFMDFIQIRILVYLLEI